MIWRIFSGGLLLLYVYIYRVDTRVAGQRGIIWIRWCVSRQCTSVRNKCIDFCPHLIYSSPHLPAGYIYVYTRASHHRWHLSPRNVLYIRQSANKDTCRGTWKIDSQTHRTGKETEDHEELQTRWPLSRGFWDGRTTEVVWETLFIYRWCVQYWMNIYLNLHTPRHGKYI